MSLPDTSRLELPILQELKATGGGDQLRYLYDRLARYFPQLRLEDFDDRANNSRRRWQRTVQRAGKQLEERGELKREKTTWRITARGLKRVETEAMQPDAKSAPAGYVLGVVTHKQAQVMLVEIGRILGRHAEMEFDHYDVVWRDSASAPRLSHVFEVQISGSVDSALTRLKQAHDTQRSRIFLVTADERDTQFARKRLTGSFHEIWDAVSVIGVGELQRFYDSLKSLEPVLEKLVSRS